MRVMFSGCSKLTNVIFGAYWGSQESCSGDFISLYALPSALTDETWSSLLTIYDRQTAGYDAAKIEVSSKQTPPSGWTDKMTARGYTISIK